ncbi:MAG: elongation factor G, partial [Planctomycetota bacterium]
TMLAEAMLYKTGTLPRLGRIADGTTASDCDDEEKSRRCSITPTVLHCHHAGREFNLIDAPGGLDFFGGQVAAISGADMALLCVNAAKGVEVITRKAWDLAGKLGRPRLIAITRMDAENVSREEVLASIRRVFGKQCLPFNLPRGEGSGFTGVVDVFGKEIPPELVQETETLRNALIECVVETDDAMMEKYLEEGRISHEEFLALLTPAIVRGTIVPVFFLSAEKDLGVRELLDGIAAYGPCPCDLTLTALRGEGEGEETVPFTPSLEQPLLAQVFKVISDPHIGKLCFVRVWNGTLESKGTFLLSTTGKPERVAQLYRHNGEKHEDIPAAACGDIVTIGKVEALNTGDILYAAGAPLRLPPLPFPKPMVGLAVIPKARGDEQKIGQVLQRLSDEDPTFLAERDNQTKELVVRGMGQLHLDVMLARMKNRFHVEVNTKPPKIPYLETISARADGHYRHKKQTGGAGQFAEVYFHVWPNERGKGFEFVNSIVGGAISASFVGSTEKGVRHGLEKGPLSGFPVVDIVVEVYDGKEHPVDSKDIAFQTAGRHALHDAMQNARPVLLEPIVDLEVLFPPAYTGDINGDISGRRGRPTGMEMVGDMQMLKAQVPLAEIMDYGSTLKAITQGEGFFSMELARYEPIPSNVAQAVLARLKAAAEAEEK